MFRHPHDYQKNQVDRWVENSRKFSGYVNCNTGALDKEDIPTNTYDPYVNESHKRQWEFRIAVLPSRENLNNAVEALKIVFQKEENAGIDFKCLVLNNEEDAKLVSEGWDGTIASGSDRDQRGKEICVYMAFDPQTNQYQRSPDQFKKLMLDCWKSLIDQGVEKIGYHSIPNGDNPVATEIGLSTPFSYTCYKPYKNKHGLLFQTNYNPFNHPDPLQGVIITSDDLLNYQIPLSAAKDMAANKLVELQEHNRMAFQRVKNRLISLSRDVK